MQNYKLLAGLTAISIVFGLAGCNNESTPTGGNTQPPVVTTTAPQTPAVTEEPTPTFTFPGEHEVDGLKIRDDVVVGTVDRFLTEVVIPEGVTAIARQAFKDNEVLISVTFPPGLETIGEGAFKGCTSLVEVSLPEGLTTIDRELFHGATSLERVYIPETVTEIRRAAFFKCTSLTELELPRGLRVLESAKALNFADGMFTYTKLTEIVIPGGVTEIGDLTFNNMPLLERVVIEEGVKAIGANAFYGNYNSSSLVTVELPDTLIEIGNKAFMNSTSLTSIEFPDGLMIIGENAFSRSGLTAVELPSATRIVESTRYNLNDSFDTTVVITRRA